MQAIMCNRGDLLVGYIYDEISERDRREVEAHLGACGECRSEVEGLRATRGHLALWAPPQRELGFRIISGSAAPAPIPALPPRRSLAPAFAFAAAAVIVLAVAAAIANVEVRYGTDGVTVRTGWARAIEAPAVTADRGPAQIVQPVAASDFAALEQRLTEIEHAIARSTPGTGVQNASANGRSDAEVLRRVREMLKEAEARQQTAVAQQLAQLVRDFDRQRRSDLANLQQGFGQHQNLMNAEIATQRDLVNQFNQYIRANSKQER